jgi:hypothetical protein
MQKLLVWTFRMLVVWLSAPTAGAEVVHLLGSRPQSRLHQCRQHSALPAEVPQKAGNIQNVDFLAWCYCLL